MDRPWLLSRAVLRFTAPRWRTRVRAAARRTRVELWSACGGSSLTSLRSVRFPPAPAAIIRDPGADCCAGGHGAAERVEPLPHSGQRAAHCEPPRQGSRPIRFRTVLPTSRPAISPCRRGSCSSWQSTASARRLRRAVPRRQHSKSCTPRAPLAATGTTSRRVGLAPTATPPCRIVTYAAVT
jgi:hypothetical protein